MSDSRQDLPRLVGDLVETVEELQSELEPDSRLPLRPPTPRELARFTSEVTIPAIILALETNVRALRLLQRALRLGTGGTGGTSATGDEARERARAVGRTTLARLEEAFTDLQDALEGRPTDDRTRELLDDARDIRAEIDERLARTDAEEGSRQDRARDPTTERNEVDIDVESELRSIKDDLDDGDPDDE